MSDRRSDERFDSLAQLDSMIDELEKSYIPIELGDPNAGPPGHSSYKAKGKKSKVPAAIFILALSAACVFFLAPYIFWQPSEELIWINQDIISDDFKK